MSLLRRLRSAPAPDRLARVEHMAGVALRRAIDLTERDLGTRGELRIVRAQLEDLTAEVRELRARR